MVQEELVAIARRLGAECAALEFGPPVAWVYNPLAYAWAPHEQYLRRFARPRPDAILLGMNPGPFGMLQTGVPFGDVVMVRDWLGIEAPVGRPEVEHPKRPVEGFACRRREVSGSRVWGWARDTFGTPDRFFDRFFVINYCPLAFFEEGGQNRTPDKLPRNEQAALFEVCDRALAQIVGLLKPSLVIGIGRFAEQRAAVTARNFQTRVATVTHPSPANPKANAEGWSNLMNHVLRAHGFAIP
jgi:single-strand selective monofunctional uracil DNA glycosylase